jgi:hypothetical protein
MNWTLDQSACKARERVGRAGTTLAMPNADNPLAMPSRMMNPQPGRDDALV